MLLSSPRFYHGFVLNSDIATTGRAVFSFSFGVVWYFLSHIHYILYQSVTSLLSQYGVDFSYSLIEFYLYLSENISLETRTYIAQLY